MQFEIKKAGSWDETKMDERVSWPWRNMEVGDMTTIPDHLVERAQVGCHVYGKARGKKFKTRKQSDGTLAVWRTE